MYFKNNFLFSNNFIIFAILMIFELLLFGYIQEIEKNSQMYFTQIREQGQDNMLLDTEKNIGVFTSNTHLFHGLLVQFNDNRLRAQ